MTPSSKQWNWQLRLAISLTLACMVTTAGDYASAQISSDGTLPTNVTTPDNRNFTITGGNRAASNLFHSFREFSVPTGGSAFFNNAPDVKNIITRVTGGSASNIDGLIQANGTANLFLLNPNGIIFGSNASLDIRGSFVGSTANSLKFADGTSFSATAASTTPLLTVSVPIGLQYGASAGDIRVQGSNLQVLPGNTLALVGGDVKLDKGTLTAPGGRVEVGGLAGTGTVGLNENGNNLDLSFGDGVARADVSLTNSSLIETTAGGGGSIAINARNVEVLGESRIETGIGQGLGSVGSQSGEITLNATQSIKIGQSSRIQNRIQPGATGEGGNINITARSLSLTNESMLSTRTRGQGNAGSVFLQVNDSVSLADTSSIQSIAFDEATGDGGNINVQTRSISLTDGSELLASTFGAGKAGNIQVNASDSINLSGVATTGDNSGVSSGLFTSTEQENAGQGGNIRVTTNELRLSDGAVLSARTINASSGGNIKVDANTLELTGGGQILTTAYSTGRAGNIEVNAPDSITLSGSDPTYFARLAQAEAESNRFVVDNDGPASAMSARSEGTGAAGNLTVTTGQLRVQDGARLAVSVRELANAGNLSVTAGSIFLDKNAELTASNASGQGGNINLKTQGLLQLRRNSSISATAGGTGNGGNIDINSPLIVAVPRENSDITARASQGQGGNIQIRTTSIFGLNFQNPPSPETSDITASSEFGINGTVRINTPDVDPSFGLVTLPAELADASNQIAQGCSTGGNSVASNQFIITGRGGLPPSPNETLNGEAVLTDWATLEPKIEKRSAAKETTTKRTSSAITQIVPAQGWVISPLGEVLLTASAPNATLPIPWMTATSCHANQEQ